VTATETGTETGTAREKRSVNENESAIATGIEEETGTLEEATPNETHMIAHLHRPLTHATVTRAEAEEADLEELALEESVVRLRRRIASIAILRARRRACMDDRRWMRVCCPRRLWDEMVRELIGTICGGSFGAWIRMGVGS
jgi:hypothetical protein